MSKPPKSNITSKINPPTSPQNTEVQRDVIANVQPDYIAKVAASRRAVAAAAEAKKNAPLPPVVQTDVRPPVRPAPVPVVVPEPPVPPQTNLDELETRFQRLGAQYHAKLDYIFLVRPDWVEYGIGSDQPVIGFNLWRKEYQKLEIFQQPKQFYVVIVAEDGAAVNQPWLASIAKDIWLRERCLVVRIETSNPVPLFQYRQAYQRPSQYGTTAEADKRFAAAERFQPIPTPNHVRELEALTKDAKPRDVPQMLPIDQWRLKAEADDRARAALQPRTPDPNRPKTCAGGFVIDQPDPAAFWADINAAM